MANGASGGVEMSAGADEAVTLSASEVILSRDALPSWGRCIPQWPRRISFHHRREIPEERLAFL
ncbi:MAG: hypothetical protein A2Y73_02450 [Chloroflexi bacterium RBG_13_56_8]|nr:MAG: hypothetical protein A2Y73_02450 [Chloroflexi bacterium RBG_13_56_8]